ncbi:MAG: hypothetical protein U9Q74_02515 [Gemmatimonadota bacterium]|nr:hypothetical protein [Gemmatimonadota bacterium]
MVLAAACGGEPKAAPPAGAAPAITGAPAAAVPVPAGDVRPAGTGMLDSGAVIRGMLSNPLSSLADRRGAIVDGVVTGDVTGPDGRVAIPSGSRLDIRIDRLEAARNAAGPTGIVELSPVAVYVQADTIRLTGTIDAVPFLARGTNVIVERAAPLVIRLTRRLPRRP